MKNIFITLILFASSFMLIQAPEKLPHSFEVDVKQLQNSQSNENENEITNFINDDNDDSNDDENDASTNIIVYDATGFYDLSTDSDPDDDDLRVTIEELENCGIKQAPLNFESNPRVV